MSNPHVFISYSTQDSDFAQKLTQDLQAVGVEVWIDKHGLKAGTPDWENAIREAIRNAYAILLVASPDSRDSRYVRDELLIAEMYKRDVVAIWARGDKWPECVRMGYIGTQYADGRDKKYHDGVLETVNALRGFLQPSTVVEVKAAPKVLPPNFVPRNPYKGLRAFTSADKGDFFGRDKLIDELVESLKENTDTNRFLAVVGASGSGKSSIVMAGLLPRLQAGALPGSDKWIYLEPVLPGNQPLESLAVVLANALNLTIGSILDELDRNSRSLSLLVKQLAKGQIDTRVVLLIDQFEELFTQTTDEDRRNHIIDLLVTAVTESSGQLIVLITFRADFYDRPMNYPELGKLLEKRTKSVLPMSVEDLRDVIEKPATLPDVQLRFEEGLVGDLLFEVRGQIGALPLLQFTLNQITENRNGSTLTNEAYRNMGGVKGALAKHAEEIYAKLPTDRHREMTRALFLRLIEPGAIEQDTTRRRAAQTELITPNKEQSELLNEILNAFTEARLITTSNVAYDVTFEVSHEALIQHWERLATWVKTAREDIQLQIHISNDAYDWIKRGKRQDDLYRGLKLQEAFQWANRNTPSQQEVEFIEAARELERSAGSQSEFVGFVAHELKTPMTSMKGYADLLVAGMAGDLNPQQKNFLNTIRINIDRMNTLVSDLNDLTKLQYNNMRIELTAVNFANIVNETLRSLTKQIEDKHQTLSVNIQEPLPSIMADQNRLIQVMTNLVSNAWKYSPEDSQISISAEVIAKNSDTKKKQGQGMEIHVVVKDQGIGMSEEDMERLFTPYFRSNNPLALQQPGSGLGLAVTKGIIALHNGQIWVESELGKGSQFHFVLPIQQ